MMVPTSLLSKLKEVEVTDELQVCLLFKDHLINLAYRSLHYSEDACILQFFKGFKLHNF